MYSNWDFTIEHLISFFKYLVVTVTLFEFYFIWCNNTLFFLLLHGEWGLDVDCKLACLQWSTLIVFRVKVSRGHENRSCGHYARTIPTYFQITQPGRSAVTPLFQYRRHYQILSCNSIFTLFRTGSFCRLFSGRNVQGGIILVVAKQHSHVTTRTLSMIGDIARYMIPWYRQLEYLPPV
jgi:hypothetical protein